MSGQKKNQSGQKKNQSSGQGSLTTVCPGSDATVWRPPRREILLDSGNPPGPRVYGSDATVWRPPPSGPYSHQVRGSKLPQSHCGFPRAGYPADCAIRWFPSGRVSVQDTRTDSGVQGSVSARWSHQGPSARWSPCSISAHGLERRVSCSDLLCVLLSLSERAPLSFVTRYHVAGYYLVSDRPRP